MIRIPDSMRRPAEKERDELKAELAKRDALIEQMRRVLQNAVDKIDRLDNHWYLLDEMEEMQAALDSIGPTVADVSKLDLLRQKCKCGVHVTINNHRDLYEPVQLYVDSRGGAEELEIAPDVLEKMIELDTVVEVQFYPDTPVGFYLIFHHSLDAALSGALDLIDPKGTEHARTE